MKKYIQSGVGVLIGVALVYFAFKDTNWGEVFASIRHVSPGWLVISICIAVASFFTRAQRWAYIVRVAQPVSFRHLFSATQIGFLVNFTIPVRLGELVRALCRSHCRDGGYLDRFSHYPRRHDTKGYVRPRTDSTVGGAGEARRSPCRNRTRRAGRRPRYALPQPETRPANFGCGAWRVLEEARGEGPWHDRALCRRSTHLPQRRRPREVRIVVAGNVGLFCAVRLHIHAGLRYYVVLVYAVCLADAARRFLDRADHAGHGRSIPYTDRLGDSGHQSSDNALRCEGRGDCGPPAQFDPDHCERTHLPLHGESGANGVGP
ncbi:MAG: flippase-like domain-containing protein [Candidatus Hydrogenedentes bacterium]|nr:flippase-like domain-containing protein [Candidatus Hydrogenedentota bacterium]